MSNDGKYFACRDTAQNVTLFKKEMGKGDPYKSQEWQYSNKKKSHEIEITSIAFGESLDENEEVRLRLFSVGRDRRVIEYDVYSSN